MLFELKREIFEGGVGVNALGALAHYAAKRSHRLLIPATTAESFESFLANQSAALQDEWRAIIRSSEIAEGHNPSTRRFAVGLQPSNLTENHLCFTDAEILCNLPFSILLENGLSDRGFILSMANGDMRAAFLKAEQEGQIAFCHCGGIDEIIPRAVALLERNPLARLRMCALLDSDAAVPFFPSRRSTEIVAELTRQQIPAFRLTRRAIENYLPFRVIRLWLESRPPERQAKLSAKLTALAELPIDARSVIHMKEGLRQDRNVFTLVAAEVSRYTDLTAERVQAFLNACHQGDVRGSPLTSGFGDEITDAYRDAQFFDAFRQLDLRAGKQHEEVEPMLHKLLQLAA